MHTSLLRTAFTAGLAIVSRAQEVTPFPNHPFNILSCNDLESVDLEAGTVCKSNQTRATGVGIAADVFTVNETSLSLTLVDDGQDGDVEHSAQNLYVGASSDLDVSDQPPACALMLQYQGSTFPNVSGQSASSTTSCGNILPRWCLENVTRIVQDVQYAAVNETGRGRCDLLASHVHDSLLQKDHFCGLWSGDLNITGGAIFGPKASNTSVELQESGGQPVSPEDYDLHKTVSVVQLFHSSEDEWPVRDYGGERPSHPIRGAGRKGATPVAGVFYSSDDDEQPIVQFACMRTFTPGGEQLPSELDYPKESDAAPNGARFTAVMVVVAMFMHTLC